MAYHDFKNYINSEKIKTIFELGSRDLEDGVKLINTYDNATCYSFECNPDCLIECKKKMKAGLKSLIKSNVNFSGLSITKTSYLLIRFLAIFEKTVL